MNAGEAIANELPGNVRNAVTFALFPLLLVEGHPRADAVEDVPGAVGDTSVESSVRIAIERAAGRIRRVLVHARHLERLAVVERGVSAAMPDRHRMIQ